MKVRPNTWDAEIVSAVMTRNEYNLPQSMRGMTVLDIGAHIGTFAVACAERGAKTIYCFEPDPENFELLKENTAEYSSVVLFNAAVVPYQIEGQHTIGVRRLTNHDQGMRNTGHVDVFGEEDGTTAIPIQSILAQLQSIDFMKVDCEGMEWALFDVADLSKVKHIEAELHNIRGVQHSIAARYQDRDFLTLAQQLSANLHTKGFEVSLVCSSYCPRGTELELAKLSAKRSVPVEYTAARKPRLLWIGDANVHSGYARVTDNICRRLIELGWDVKVLGIGYNGDPHNHPYKIYPAVDPNTGGHRNGLSRLKDVLTRVNPDIVLIQDDSWNVGITLEHLAMNNLNPPTVGYVAIDSENVRKEVAAQLRNTKHIICHTQFGADQLKLAGYNGPISVAGHGVDSNLYNVYSKKEAREGIASGSRNIVDAFIWGVVAANQPRKRLDLSIAYFAAWWKSEGKPANTYLYFHTNAGAYNLKQIAEHYGVRSQIIVTDGGQQLPETHLPSLYSALDCMIHTSEGESWGLTALEGMACGVPQIAVKTGGMPSWAGDAVRWVKPSYYQFTPDIGSKRWIASEEDFVKVMHDMYRVNTQLEIYSKRGRELAEKLTWEVTANHFDQTLRRILETRQAAKRTETDALSEFM